MINCIFNSNDLNANGYEVLDIDYGMPTSNVNKFQLARADGQVVTGQTFGERKIKISGRVNASNRKDLDQKLDTLKAYFVGINKNVDLTIADATRRYVGTMESFTYTKSGYACNFDVVLTCDAFGKDTSATTLTMGTYTDGDEPYANTILGTYKSKPIIDFTINSVFPYWEQRYIQFANNALNQIMRITREWNFLDRVIINGDTKSVTIYPTTKTVIDTCDDDTDWTSTHTLSIDSDNQIEGVGALSVTMASGATSTDFQKLDGTAIDLSDTAGTIMLALFIPTPTAGVLSGLGLWLGTGATFASPYARYDISTQFDGSALATNAWNYIAVDLSETPAFGGAVDRSEIVSLMLVVKGTTSAFRLVGAMLDYITVIKASAVGESLDYEGIFPDLAVGSSTITVTDELDDRNITIAGTYFKRYL